VSIVSHRAAAADRAFDAASLTASVTLPAFAQVS